ncbi:MAG: MBG domain-containing protein, partial [Rhizomicrobium sp.]
GGPYQITVGAGTLTSLSGYAFAFSSTGNLTVTQALLSVTANPLSKVYGSADPALTYGVSGLVNGDTSAVFSGALSRASGENVGSYAISQGTLSAGTNYTIAFTGANFAITPATLTYVADSASRTYGGANPTFDGTVTGLVNGDTLASATTGALSFDSPATASSNVGSYAINGSGLTANNGNYVFAQSAANATALTINPATLTYVANAGSITVGSDIPTLTGTVTGFVNGDTLASATNGTPVFTTTATKSSPAGVYAIDGSGLSAVNYLFIQDPGNAMALTINDVVTQSLPPELNSVVVSSIQTNNNGSTDTNSPPDLPTVAGGDASGDAGGGLYSVVGHTAKGPDLQSANTVVLSGPLAQLAADSVFGVAYVESPTLADRASRAMSFNFVAGYHDDFSSWGNDAFWH